VLRYTPCGKEQSPEEEYNEEDSTLEICFQPFSTTKRSVCISNGKAKALRSSFSPKNRLEETLLLASKQEVHKSRLDFYRALLEATCTQSPTGPRIQNRLLGVVDFMNKTYVPVLSSEEAANAYQLHFAAHLEGEIFSHNAVGFLSGVSKEYFLNFSSVLHIVLDKTGSCFDSCWHRVRNHAARWRRRVVPVARLHWSPLWWKLPKIPKKAALHFFKSTSFDG